MGLRQGNAQILQRKEKPFILKDERFLFVVPPYFPSRKTVGALEKR